MDSWALEFRLKQEYVKLKRDEMAALCEKLMKETFGDVNLVFKVTDDTVFRLLFTGQFGVGILVQAKEDCLLTVDIHWPKANDAKFRQKVEQFVSTMQKANFYQSPKTREYPYKPPIKRGRPISKYTGCYEELTEYDFDRIVHDEISDYQHILILHSPQYGNCLFLDNSLNIAESDIEYTRAVTGFDQENYRGKTVLILGGGDGGILHYLKDRGPAMITLIDIDQKVIDASKVHLRGVCHDALDSLSAENHEVIVDDCIKHLEKYAEEKREFDYVISDLTDVPISTDPNDGEWEMLRKVLCLSMKVLKDDGKLLTHCEPTAARMFEEQAKTLDCPLKLEKRGGHVPTFHEIWYFYTLRKDN